MSTKKQPIPDDQLIKGCLKNKPDAQKALYDKYAKTMFGICMRYSKNRHYAEDLLQEGFLKVFKYLKNFRGDGSFEGWLRRIFVNTAIEYYRKNSPMYSMQDIPEKYHQQDTNPAISDMSADELMELVNQLSDGYRLVFNLYVIEGLNHREIGEKLKISEGTSKSQLARARALLQKMIKEREPQAYGTAI